MSEVDPLLTSVVNSLPKQFFQQFVERQFALYAQSLDKAFGDSWDKPEGFAALQGIRRALWESETRKIAQDCNLQCLDMDHAARNCTYVLVTSGPLRVSIHYVDGPDEFVREAESRKQNRGMNRWVDHYLDKGMFIQMPPQIDRSPIYLNILHGAKFPKPETNSMTIDQSSCFLRIALPDSTSNKYLRNWSFQEIMQSYVSVTSSPAANVAIEDKAIPKPKRTAKKSAGQG